jgi:uncharacterized protein with HEPN domain
VSRSESERLVDMLEALDRCTRFLPHVDDGDPIVADMALDAILRNLAVVGEAARTLPAGTRDHFPGVPWPSSAGLRNILIHEYFRIDVDIIRDIVETEIEPLAEAIRTNLAAQERDDAAGHGDTPDAAEAPLPPRE